MVGSKDKIKFEFGHVTYQIKEKDVQTNIEANTLTLHILLTSGSGKVRY